MLFVGTAFAKQMDFEPFEVAKQYLTFHYDYLSGKNPVNLNAIFNDQQRIAFERGRSKHWKKWYDGLDGSLTDYTVEFTLVESQDTENVASLAIKRHLELFFADEEQAITEIETFDILVEKDSKDGNWYITSPPQYQDVNDLNWDWAKGDKGLDEYFATKNEKKVVENDTTENMPLSFGYRAYNRFAARDYARLYSEDYKLVGDDGNRDFSYNNDEFKNYADDFNDCQNFASQCVWAGFGGTDSYGHYYPMIDDYHGARDWFADTSSSTSYVSDCTNHCTWVNCYAFRDMVTQNYTEDNYGVQGTLYTGGASEAYRMTTGDILYCHRGHAIVITDINDTAGDGTDYDDLYVCAHTYNKRDNRMKDIYTSAEFNNLGGYFLKIMSFKEPLIQ